MPSRAAAWLRSIPVKSFGPGQDGKVAHLRGGPDDPLGPGGARRLSISGVDRSQTPGWQPIAGTPACTSSLLSPPVPAAEARAVVAVA